MGETTTVSVYASEDLVNEFDDVVWELKTSGELDRDASRSEVLRQLMEAFAEGKLNSPTTDAAK